MSKFIEKLKQASLTAPQQMGFRVSTSSSSKPRMVLVAGLTEGDQSGNLAGYVAGADAGLVSISKLSSGCKVLEKLSREVPEIPWGGRIADTGGGEIELLVKAGADFVFFPASSSIGMAQKEGMGSVLEVEASIGEDLLRAMDQLPVDAALIGGEEGGLTWRRLIVYYRYASILGKPLLVPIPSQVKVNELQALWEAGVDGVLVEVGAEQSAGRVNELRQAIDKLTIPVGHKRRKGMGALLPHISPAGGKETEEEEEGE